jgi:hypothetical protein
MLASSGLRIGYAFLSFVGHGAVSTSCAGGTNRCYAACPKITTGQRKRLNFKPDKIQLRSQMNEVSVILLEALRSWEFTSETGKRSTTIVIVQKPRAAPVLLIVATHRNFARHRKSACSIILSKLGKGSVKLRNF